MQAAPGGLAWAPPLHGQAPPCREKQLPTLRLGAAALLRTQPGCSYFFSVFPGFVPPGAMTVLPKTQDQRASSLLLVDCVTEHGSGQG